MTIDVLGDRMHDEIRSMIQGILDVRAHEGVVHHHHDAMTVRNVCDLADINQAQSRV